LSIPLSVGAVLAVLVAGAHSYLGERYILTRLFRRQDLPKIRGSSQFTKDTLRFAWHLTSVAWIGCAALLASLASAPRGNLQTRILSGTFAFSGVVTLVGSRGRHLAWVVFFAIAALAWYGSW
jgi:hypothetical protein